MAVPFITMATTSAPPDTRQGRQTVIMTDTENQSPGTWVSSNKNDLNHWIPIQQDQKLFQCGLCSMTFDLNSELVSHVQKHYRPKPYQCGYCKVSYHNNTELIVHTKTHAIFMIHVPAIPSSPPQVCTSDDEPDQTVLAVCPNPSDFRPAAEKSQGDPHTTQESSVHSSSQPHSITGDDKNNDLDLSQIHLHDPCICSKMNTKLQTEFDTLQNCCCGKNVKVEQIDDNTDKPVKSDPCPQVEVKTKHQVANLSETEQVAEQMNQVEAAEKEEVDFDFKYNTDPERPFHCRICGASFRVARYAKEHEKKVHKLGKLLQTEGIKSTEKTQANGNMETEQNLQMKSAEKNGAGIYKSTERPFHCNICGASFRVARYAREHEKKVHKLFKTQKVKSIEEKQSDGGNIEGEQKNKAGVNCNLSTERPFHCNICGASFRVARYARDHEKRIHKLGKLHQTKGVKSVEEKQANLNSTERNTVKSTETEKKKVDSNCDEAERLFRLNCDTSFRIDNERRIEEESHKFLLQTESMKSAEEKQAAIICESAESPFHNDLSDASFRLVHSDDKGKELEHEVPLSKNDRTLVFYECPHCPFKTIGKSKLRSHIVKVHEKQKPFICSQCGNGFLFKSGLDNHVQKLHSKEMPHKCHDCGKSFKIRKDLTQHFCKPKECPICNYTSKSAMLYNLHMRRMHSKVHFQCSLCEFKGVLTGGQVDYHIRTHTRKHYICGICGKSCLSKGALNSHHNHVHLKQNSRQQRNITNNVTHHANLCDICGKSCGSLQALARHRDIVHHIKSYKCDVCLKGFSSYRGLSAHKLQHASVEKSCYVCETCGKTFTRPQNLEYHRNSFHLKNRPFKCNICQKGFSSHPGWWIHRLRHTGNKKHHCDHHQCNKTFYTYSALRKHALTHTDLRTYVCSLCGKTYRTRGSLVYHLKHSHGSV